MNTGYPSVRVVELVTLHASKQTMESDWTAPRATADILTDGVLLVTNVVDGAVIRTFLRGQWRAVSAYGPDGHLNFTFTNDAAWQGHVESRDRRTLAGGMR